MNFHSVGNVIVPTDELIFFRGVGLNHQLDLKSEAKIVKHHISIFFRGLHDIHYCTIRDS